MMLIHFIHNFLKPYGWVWLGLKTAMKGKSYRIQVKQLKTFCVFCCKFSTWPLNNQCLLF